MSKVIEISEDNFESEVLKSELPVLVDFWAPWCGPCRMMGPIVDEISEENLELKVCKVNVDENQDLAMKYNIMNVPTLLFIKNKKIIKSSIGFCSKSELNNIINGLL